MDFRMNPPNFSIKMDNCPICKDWCGPKSAAISKRRAANTAHVLASKKADEGIPGLEWEDVYAVYFPKIYQHEYKRNILLEREIELEESVKRNKNHPDVCEYHYENICWMEDGYHKKTMKELRKVYAETKWPKGAVKNVY